jgi:hypothetical protein
MTTHTATPTHLSLGQIFVGSNTQSERQRKRID